MRYLWIRREVAAPAEVLWELLVVTAEWPRWGPTVRRAAVDGGRISLGATGTVTTVVGLDLPFVVTTYLEGRRWGWEVAGIRATEHEVESLSFDRCRVGFGVPWPAMPYLAVCWLALHRLDGLATGGRPRPYTAGTGLGSSDLRAGRSGRPRRGRAWWPGGSGWPGRP